MSSSVQLVWITPGAENTIEYCARVSSPKNQEKMESGELSPGRLLRYCADKGHVSIFEMANACLCLNTTRDISAQILRHRSFSFQEFSQRYSKVTDRPSPPELRLQDPDNRQNSIKAHTSVLSFEQDIQDHFDAAFDLYDRMLAQDIARESARSVLPLRTPTKLYMNGTIRSWITYFKVRCAPETQQEHREVALKARALLARNLPLVAQAFDWNE